MRELTTLGVLVLMALAVNAGVDHLPHAPNGETVRAALSAGLLILGAWLSGLACERIALPAITGYLLFGVAAGPFVLGLLPESQVMAGTEGGDPPLRFANDLAIALIALVAGGEIQLAWLRGRLRAVSLVILFHVAILFAMVAAAILLCRPFVPFLADVDSQTAGVIAVLTAVVMVAKSPSVTVAMISDYRAAGPLSQTTLVVTVIKDLVLIVLFATVMAVSKGLLDERTALSGAFVLALGVQLIGSVALGAIFGLLMAWYVQRVAAHLAILVVGGCLLIALIGEQRFYVMGQGTHLEPLLMALSAGLLMRNAWPRHTAPLFHTLETMSLPIYCLFFALTGASVDLGVFADLWYLAVGLAAVRALATWGGVELGMRAAGLREPWARLFWLGLISQAGVSLVLVTVIAETFAEAWAAPLRATLIGAILINQLVGPIGFRYALMASGEAGQAERRRRSPPGSHEDSSRMRTRPAGQP